MECPSRARQANPAHGAGGTIRFDSPPQVDGLGYTVELDLDQNGSFGDAGDVVSTDDLDSAGGNSFAWDGKDAGGAAPGCGSYAYRVRSTLAEVHLTQDDVERSEGTQIQRLSLPSDPALGDPFAASYNDVDPYKGVAITNSSPSAVDQGTSGPTFHAWSTTGPGGTGNADFVDTWMRLPESSAAGTLQVCVPAPPPPPPPGGSGEVSVDKRASDGRVTLGDTVTYRLVARNNGSDEATGVVVEDRVPSKLDVRSASSTEGDCSVQGNRVRCGVGTLAAGQEATVTVRAVAIEAGVSTNTGIVISDPCPRCGSEPAEATDPAKVTIVKPKLRLAKTAARAKVRAGGIVNYTIRVTNPSKRAVLGVRTCDHLPAGLVAVKASPEVKISKGRYCWTAKRIGARRSQSYELNVRALPGAAGRIVNRATASAAGARNTARAARAIQVLPRQAAGGGVTG
jgi:uncharacterized repeat protein (TIGR01451 family)